MSIRRTTLQEHHDKGLAAARKEGRTGPKEAAKEESRSPKTWKQEVKCQTLKS